MSEAKFPAYVRYLLQEGSYPHPAADISLVQTHISFVFLAGDSVYKWKKPVDFGFLNFSTLEKRKFFCEQELLLNRRLCPDIYEELVTLTEEGEGFSLNGSGNVVEYGIKMKRMPEEKMMGRIMAGGQLTHAHIDSIIDALVPFYQAAVGDKSIQKFGQASSVAVNVLENFDQTEAFIGQGALSRAQFDTISSYAREFLGHKDRFQGRIDEGKIRDCHGDMHSANICLADPVCIFDCIEFNDRFRYTDVAADVAFLAMDLDFHGLKKLSNYFVEEFVAKSEDSDLQDMLDFYKCYRAYVRGKIGLFTASDPAVDGETANHCLEQARKHFLLAEQYATAK
jgi:uncharacterized protein